MPTQISEIQCDDVQHCVRRSLERDFLAALQSISTRSHGCAAQHGLRFFTFFSFFSLRSNITRIEMIKIQESVRLVAHVPPTGTASIPAGWTAAELHFCRCVFAFFSYFSISCLRYHHKSRFRFNYCSSASFAGGLLGTFPMLYVLKHVGAHVVSF